MTCGAPQRQGLPQSRDYVSWGVPFLKDPAETTQELTETTGQPWPLDSSAGNKCCFLVELWA